MDYLLNIYLNVSGNLFKSNTVSLSKILPPHQNLRENSGSESLTRLGYEATSRASYIRRPETFLVVSFTLLVNPWSALEERNPSFEYSVLPHRFWRRVNNTQPPFVDSRPVNPVCGSPCAYAGDRSACSDGCEPNDRIARLSHADQPRLEQDWVSRRPCPTRNLIASLIIADLVADDFADRERETQRVRD